MPYKNREDNLAFRRRYKKTEKWKVSTKYYDAAKHANQRAVKYGAVGIITATVVRRILEHKPNCFYCGKNGFQTIDHVIPLHLKGVNGPQNIVAACRSCNISKYRGIKPHEWSRHGDKCRRCETNEKKHLARGFCCTCYYIQFSDRRRLSRSNNKSCTII